MNFPHTFPLARVLFVGIVSVLSFGLNGPVSAAEGGQGVKVVVIDAGHGGPRFPGAHYGGYYEKNINLQVALKLGRLIEQEMPGIKVVYTRKSDKSFANGAAFPADLNKDLSERANIANRAEGDLFISIHANAARSTAARGVETLIMGESEKETRINEAVLYANNKEEFIDMSDERTAAIVRAYIQNLQFTYGEYSEAMARIVQRSYAKKGYHDRGIKRQPLKVLYATDMPSILTEIGFMSNAAELKYITSERGQQEIARALLGAVKEYAAYVDGTCLHDETSTAPAAPAASSSASASAAGETQTTGEVSKDTAPKPDTKPAVAPQKRETAAKSGYTIQLLASAKRISLKSSELKSYRGKAKEYTSPGRYKYKYCYGTYSSRTAAAGDLRAVKRVFKDAYIVRFKGDKIE